MPVVAVVIEPLPAFGDGQEIIIIAPGGAHIEEVGASFARPDSLAVDAVVAFVVAIVAHGLGIQCVEAYVLWLI